MYLYHLVALRLHVSDPDNICDGDGLHSQVILL